jgi:F-type H+-transporting ATPase subunit delta
VKAHGLARRYARALLDLAGASPDKIGRDLDDFAAAWSASAELREVFENPSFGADDRRKLLDALALRMGLSAEVKNTLKMLADRRRLRIVPEIAGAYRALAEQKAGRVRASVVTATPMPEAYFAELTRVLEQVTGKKVTLERRHDPTLIAGVVTRVGDKVFDGSLKTRLDELKDTLLHR